MFFGDSSSDWYAALELLQSKSVMPGISTLGSTLLRIFGCAMVGLFIGLLFLYEIVVGAMMFNNWLVDVLIVGATAFIIFAVITVPLRKLWWVALIFSSTPVLALVFSVWITDGPEWTFCGLFVTALLSGLGGTFVGARWLSG
jgi:hypothetical protein